jgi:hypothetical protein
LKNILVLSGKAVTARIKGRSRLTIGQNSVFPCNLPVGFLLVLTFSVVCHGGAQVLAPSAARVILPEAPASEKLWTCEQNTDESHDGPLHSANARAESSGVAVPDSSSKS